MPLYEYECDACSHRFEAIRKFSDSPLERCPKCGSAVRKLQSAPAFQFKGSGWYITDYARKDRAPEAKGEGGTKDGAAGGADGPAKGPAAEKTEKAGGAEKSAAAKDTTPASASAASKDT